MSGNSVVNILCPIETINRELDFRLFFTAYCVRPGIRFIVGSRFSISDMIDEVRGGLYFGQNIRPRARLSPVERQEKQVQTLRSHGITLVMLDEEGAIMPGDEPRWKKWLDHRLYIQGMMPHEYVCTWGDWQKKYYQSLNPPCRENIVTTGHPRFDLYKPKYRSYYADEAAKWKEKYGDFVLVNTNFAWANHYRGSDFVFTPMWEYNAKDPVQRFDHTSHWAHTARVWSNMVKLISRISMEMPEVTIVIRPHPSESMKWYKNVFQDVPNVYVEHEGSVGPWLLASRAMIHDGCTTAVEAHFSGVPILNYKSVIDTRYDLELPNALGLRCQSEEQILESLHAIWQGDEKVGHTKETPEVARKLILNFEHDSFQSLAAQIQKIAETAEPGSGFNAALTHHNRYERVSTRLRHLKARLGRRERAMVDKFYGFEHTDLPQKMEKVKHITGRHDVKFEILSSRMFTVQC